MDVYVLTRVKHVIVAGEYYGYSWPEVLGVYNTLEQAQENVPRGYFKRSGFSFYKDGYGICLISRKTLGKDRKSKEWITYDSD